MTREVLPRPLGVSPKVRRRTLRACSLGLILAGTAVVLIGWAVSLVGGILEDRSTWENGSPVLVDEVRLVRHEAHLLGIYNEYVVRTSFRDESGRTHEALSRADSLLSIDLSSRPLVRADPCHLERVALSWFVEGERLRHGPPVAWGTFGLILAGVATYVVRSAVRELLLARLCSRDCVTILLVVD